MKYTNTRPGGNAKAVRFDEEDERILLACASAEKLSLSDTVRRAIRHYAKYLGVAPEPPKAA